MADRVVVMSRGKVEQIGAPKDIYRHPANRFVAEFIGNVNIFRGRVESVSNGVASLRTKLGLMTASVGNVDVKVGVESDFFINADQMQLGKPDDDRNHIVAKLLSYKFVGNMVTLYLECDQGAELKVNIPEPVYDNARIKIGDTVHTNWLVSAAHLFQQSE